METKQLFLIEPLPELMENMAAVGAKYIAFRSEHGKMVFEFIGFDGTENIEMTPDILLVK